MNISEVQKGDKIRYTIEFEVSSISNMGYLVDSKGCWWYKDIKDFPATLELISRPVKTPVNWPPETGDIWEAEGEEYTAKKTSKSDIVLYISDYTSGKRDYYLDYEFDKFMKLNPVCLRRRNK